MIEMEYIKQYIIYILNNLYKSIKEKYIKIIQFTHKNIYIHILRNIMLQNIFRKKYKT